MIIIIIIMTVMIFDNTVIRIKTMMMMNEIQIESIQKHQCKESEKNRDWTDRNKKKKTRKNFQFCSSSLFKMIRVVFVSLAVSW